MKWIKSNNLSEKQIEEMINDYIESNWEKKWDWKVLKTDNGYQINWGYLDYIDSKPFEIKFKEGEWAAYDDNDLISVSDDIEIVVKELIDYAKTRY